MKKTIAILMAIIMVFTVGVTALAESSDFIKSPSGNAAPEIETVIKPDGSEETDFFVVPFGNRHNLQSGQKEIFESSYNSIIEADEIIDLNQGLKSLASNMGIGVDKLAVGDLFYAGYTNGEADGVNTITLASDNFKHFVALMNYADGVWSIVENAKLDKDGKLAFSTNLTGPFAVVVNKEGSASAGGSTSAGGTTGGSANAGTTSPATGDSIAAFAALVAAAFVFAVGFKKALKA